MLFVSKLIFLFPSSCHFTFDRSFSFRVASRAVWSLLRVAFLLFRNALVKSPRRDRDSILRFSSRAALRFGYFLGFLVLVFVSASRFRF